MYKVLTYGPYDARGEQSVLKIDTGNAPGFTKVASSGIYAATQRFIDALKPKDGKLYVLVNAMGAGEYYGSNLNGDYFEEEELRPEKWAGLDIFPSSLAPKPIPELYGHKTFYWAGTYRSHQNKDPSKSYGKVIFAVYNDRMHRVELVIEVCRVKAAELGHADIVAKLDAGVPVAVSMGCRVKYDVCSICGNKAPTRAAYCEHAKKMMNRTLPDGRKVFVKNPQPRFHDISFVFIGADRASFAMMKVASALGSDHFIGLSCEAEGADGRQDELLTLQEKTAEDYAKRAEVLKHVPAMSAKVIRGHINCREPGLSGGALQQLGRHPFKDLLTTSAASGMVLSPLEYQTAALHNMGDSPRAIRLHVKKTIFKPTSKVDRSVSLGKPADISATVRDILSSIIKRRSALAGDLVKKASPYSAEDPAREGVTQCVEQNDEVLEVIAAGYNGYRLELLEKAATFFSQAPLDDDVFYATMMGAGGGRSSSNGLDKAAGLSEVSPETLAYIYGTQGSESGGALSSLLHSSPMLANSIMLGLARLGSGLIGSGALGNVVTKLYGAL